MANPDAIVVGSGPNGLAAAIAIAQTGRAVLVFEAQPTVGGGARSGALTRPGFVHDIGSAVHPLGAASPFFRTLPLASYGLEWVEPPIMLAHPLDTGHAAVIERSMHATAARLGPDEIVYERLIGSVAQSWPRLERTILGPLSVPRHPVAAARFAARGLRSASAIARQFQTVEGRALIAGVAAHGMIPLEHSPSASFALVLGALAHVSGWVMPRGGAQRISDALAAHLRQLGGEIVTGSPITSLDELPPSRAVLCDLSPRPLLRIAGHRLPLAYRRQLERYRYGLAAFKVDWALAAPIPWRAAECARAGTVHLGGTFDEIARSERDAWAGRVAERPYAIIVQPTLFDSSRAPEGQHVAWGYCHVPNGSTSNMLPRLEQQLERFAPGFRDCILARSVMTPADLESYNPNLVGGDIAAGATTLRQLFARPTWRWYSTPLKGLYICSASTPPGVGVHGMCGYWAAQRALREVLR